VGQGPGRHREPDHDGPDLAAARLAAQKKSLIATEQDAQARTAWQTEIAGWDAERVVFLDETSTHTSLTRSRGRAPRGARVVGRVPRNHGPNLSCLAALSLSGITAPLVIEGAVDGGVFQPWLRDWLLPAVPPGTTIVCDNLSVHRSPDVRKLVAAAGCQLRHLPAYSPDFNPIELAFSKLKTHLRAGGGRTQDTLLAAIGEGLGAITGDDARGWFRHCGYPVPPDDAAQPL
jgi:DDE superfamily endonuclease